MNCDDGVCGQLTFSQHAVLWDPLLCLPYVSANLEVLGVLFGVCDLGPVVDLPLQGQKAHVMIPLRELVLLVCMQQ